MKLVTMAIKKKLRKNNVDPEADVMPVVKWFTPDGSGTWLITDMGDDENTCFGLCDLGFGTPELGYVSLKEIEAVTGKLGLHVERDLYFSPNKTLDEYAIEAREAGRITT